MKWKMLQQRKLVWRHQNILFDIRNNGEIYIRAHKWKFIHPSVNWTTKWNSDCNFYFRFWNTFNIIFILMLLIECARVRANPICIDYIGNSLFSEYNRIAFCFIQLYIFHNISAGQSYVFTSFVMGLSEPKTQKKSRTHGLSESAPN